MNSPDTATAAMFPPLEHWKAALMQLPEGAFFDMLRSYLGDIKTPYNKQRLVDDLAAFLSRREIRRRISALLDQGDRRCIAAVGLLGLGTLQDMASFFAGDYTFADLYAIILNLEERLIIYRTMEEGQARLNLNPVLEPVLAPILEDASILFPARPLSDPLSPLRVSPELVLGALLAWLYGTSQLFKSDGSLKKRSQEELETLFASVGGAASAAELVQAMEYLGLLHIEEGQHRIDEGRLEAFASLDTGERLEFLAAALIAVELELATTRRRLSRERLQSWAGLVHRMLLFMQAAWIYPEQSLRRFWLVEKLRQGERRRFGERESAMHTGLAPCPGVDPETFFGALLRAMEKASLIAPVEGGFTRIPPLPTGSGPDQRPFIVCDASYSIIVYPEIPFAELCTLASFCRLQELGQTLKLELSREGLVRAFDRGYRVEEIQGLLERLSAKPLPQNLAWSLEEWSRRYTSAALYRGMVLVLAPERRYIAEIDLVKNHIERELAPGVYLLQDINEEQLLQELAKAGLDTIARPEPSRSRGASRSPNGEESPDAGHQALVRLSPFGKPTGILSRRSSGRDNWWFSRGAMPGISGFNITPGGTVPDRQSEPHGAGDDKEAGRRLLEDLHTRLEEHHFTREQKEELSARIDRRLILDESQLVAAAVRYEKLEAHGLDYVGKVRLAEQALSQGALVELFWRGPKGEANRAIARPLALEKSGSELMLRVEYYPEGEVFTLPVGKISLLRRLRRSIFGE